MEHEVVIKDSSRRYRGCAHSAALYPQLHPALRAQVTATAFRQLQVRHHRRHPHRKFCRLQEHLVIVAGEAFLHVDGVTLLSFKVTVDIKLSLGAANEVDLY